MEITTQTLVLIDNSLSVSKVNREITKLTLKYLFTHTPEGHAYCFNIFSHDMEYAESYTTDYIGLEDMAGRLEYKNKETSVTDVLTKVIDNWEQSDFACRNIVIFTDGLEEKSINYEREELYYLLQNNSYPVYIVCLDQTDNAEVSKNLSVISRLSKGKMFHTEFEGSDAEVERQLSEQLLQAMDEYSRENWQIYDRENVDNSENALDKGEENSVDNQGENLGNTGFDEGITDVINESIFSEDSYSGGLSEEDVIYETEKEDFFGSPMSYALIGGSLFLIVCGIFLTICLIIRNKQKIKKEDEEYRKMIQRKMNENIDSGNLRPCKDNNPFKNNHDIQTGQTVSLINRNNSSSETETRLLYADGGMTDMTFEDVNDPSKFFRISSHGKMVIGRNANQCDLVFDYDDSVSGRHCEILTRADKWFVKDLGSSNGTFVNGEKVYTERELLSGDMLKMGSLTTIVRFV